MTNLAAANKLHSLHQRLLTITADTKGKFFELGSIMKEIRDEELWMTGGYESFEAYFSDPELAFSRSSVYHAISLVENFPDWKERLPDPAIRKLIKIVPHLNDDTREELLKLASGLSSSDLDQELHDRGYKTADLAFRGLPKIYRCSTCKGVKGVFFADLCKCGWTKDQIERVLAIIREVESI